MLSYVIRTEDLNLLKQLPEDSPRPLRREWINRGTDQKLRHSSVEMLLRTLNKGDIISDSVRKLHESAGLRLHFQSEEDRNRFEAVFRMIRSQVRANHTNDQCD